MSGVFLFLGVLAVVYIIRRSIIGREWLNKRASMREEAKLKKFAAEVDSSLEKAGKVVASYGAVLEQEGELAGATMFRPLSDLPYPKSQIRGCIELLLLTLKDDDPRLNALAVADISLNDFLPEEEYRFVRQQRTGMSRMNKRLLAGEAFDKEDAKRMLDATSDEAEAQLRLLEARNNCENLATAARHKELRAEHERMFGRAKGNEALAS
jgi:hypothetical protein